MLRYVDIPRKVNIHDILNSKTSLSPHNYKRVLLNTEKYKTVKDFLADELIKGEEVGSDAYISKSHKFFIKNKALQADSFIPSFISDSVVPILPIKLSI